NPLKPRIVTTVPLSGARKIALQFRYGFVVDDRGLSILDVTDPERPRIIEGAAVPIADARDIYISRTYGYVAAGKDGLLIVDLERPAHPRIDQRFDAGVINDATAIRVGMTN